MFGSDRFHPVRVIAIKVFGDGDVRHRRGFRRTVPMLLPCREPNGIAGPDFLDRSALALNEAKTRNYEQRLPKGVAVPDGPPTRYLLTRIEYVGGLGL